MNTSAQTPFNQYLSCPETAKDLFDIHLPAELRDRCDLSSLKLVPNTLIEENLRAYYSDILYSLNTTQGAGYVYALVEHLCGAPHKCSYEKRLIMRST